MLMKILILKQGYAFSNWVEGLSDELRLGVTKRNSTKIGQPYICHRTKESFNSSKKCNLRVFPNHTKQAKINVIFHCLV